MDPTVLAQVVRGLKPQTDPNLLVGFEKASDAGIYRVADHMALVQTVDFITPITDDPVMFGRIAAANSISDVFACGGRPVTALNVLALPGKVVPPEVLGQILAGGQEAILEAGAVLVGGHTVESPELIYGLSVTGLVDPDKAISNQGARAGELLFLTKPVGTGILTTAAKQGKLPRGNTHWLEAALDWMGRLNDSASAAMIAAGTRGATDITGFGLVGHAVELAAASDVTLVIEADAVPLLEGATEMAHKGALTGADAKNRAYTHGKVSSRRALPKPLEAVFYDAQTSGGLLVAVPPAGEAAFRKRIGPRALAARIGVVEAPRGVRVELV